jgi:hypothetical protein
VLACCSQGIACANVQRKKAMLEREGVKFLGDKVRNGKVVPRCWAAVHE